MRRRVAITVLAGLLSCFGLAGCAKGPGPGPGPDRTLDEAKAALLAEERRLVASIPSEFVERHDQLDKAKVMWCSKGGYTWPDQGTIVLKGNPDRRALLEGIADVYAEDPAYAVRWDNLLDGRERLIIQARSGATYMVSPKKTVTELRLASFSDCFSLGEEQSVHVAH